MEDELQKALDELSECIIGCAIEVHRHLGAGLLESVYEAALYTEMSDAGLRCERQKIVPVKYKGRTLGEHRLDVLVEDQIVLELKSVARYEQVFAAQVLGYLRMGNYPLGLLINFNVPLLKQGIKRFIL